ncbi:MAG: carbon-nitrogen hydrolase family protein, partial [Nevskiaceae bacterium]|nr:carbon-nitrogen hydrolase family protein [Nevskiaceae bacterium]
MKVAAVQMTSTMSVQRNLDTVARLLGEAADQGAVLAVLPENFALMAQRERDKQAIAENDGEGPVQQQLSELAQRHHLVLVAGT